MSSTESATDENLPSLEGSAKYPGDMDAKARRLTAQDRCDSCSAAAGARAKLKMGEEEAGLELLFCHHHLKKNHDALVDQGWSIELESELAAV